MPDVYTWSRFDRDRIRVELDFAISDATVARVAKGQGSENSRRRVLTAAERLGLLPEQHKEAA